MTHQKNPLIHRDRRLAQHASAWARTFACEDVRPLIVCRGPIRKEAMDVFEEMGIDHYGILLSEKDTIVYTNALAPELRTLNDPTRIHQVPDYTGADRDERHDRMHQIVRIARENGYNSVFAGYGFMAEDEEFVKTIEEAGLRFLGPCSGTVRGAGRKDEAKRTALAAGVSVTPGVNNITTLTLLAKCPTLEQLRALAKAEQLDIEEDVFAGEIEAVAEALLEASYDKGIDIISIDDICTRVRDQVLETFREFPRNRVRLKAIGGGGGKGQRILAAPSSDESIPMEERLLEAANAAPAMVREVLGEVKATGVGDNKNMLIELNIEYTRHQEIQLLGNGEWCISLGARDCSLQMHEQKLLEISVTQESLKAAIEQARQAGNPVHETALQTDLAILQRMEEESVRFGQAVGLDSVSTFECIVDKERHFFMEMNTRIQVEHRVTELCYSLKFINPDDSSDSFEVDSLVEAMVLLGRHKERLPKPERIVRKAAAVEARLNATNAALAPHAGGLIHYWSDPLPDEIRDDAGISTKNPDTGQFMDYRLAGAYDSNVALLITHGEDRADSYARLYEILRRTKLQGDDLATNLEFHYGLLCWLISQGIHAKATTAFINPYLTLVGLLKESADQIDLNHAWGFLSKQRNGALARELGEHPNAKRVLDATDAVFDRKRTLISRPLQLLLDNPHVLSAWLSHNHGNVEIIDGKLHWLENPIMVLAETYRSLNMDYREDAPPAEVIWKHDHQLLQRAMRFYEELALHLGTEQFGEQRALLLADNPSQDFDDAMWRNIQATHEGYQIGMELLGLPLLLADQVGFDELRVEDDLTITIPDRLRDPALQTRMRKVLVPPPVSSGDQLLAPTGGMFYPREAPGMPSFIEEGQHFEAGQPLYIIEVMKMFNKVYAPFSGTINKALVEGDGVIVAKGQPLYQITPDEIIEQQDPAEQRAKRKQMTEQALARL